MGTFTQGGKYKHVGGTKKKSFAGQGVKIIPLLILLCNLNPSSQCRVILTLARFRFWDCDTLCCICAETNGYATEQLVFIKYGENGEEVEEFYTHCGEDWKPSDVLELKAYIVVSLYMGLKKLPNVQFYWL